MRRTISGMLLTFLLSLAFGWSGAASNQPLKVDPSRFIFEGKPGDQITGAILVANKGTEAASPKAILNDWTLDPANQLVILDEGSLPSSLTGWLKFNPRRFTAAPAKAQTVRFTVRIPSDAAPGERRGMIIFAQTAPAAEGGTGATVTVQVGSTIYVAVSPVQRTCEVTGLRMTPVPAESHTLVEAEIKGTGTGHFRGAGFFEVKPSGDASVVARGELEPIVIVPAVTALFRGGFKGLLAPGKYTLTLTVKSEEPKAKPVVLAQDFVL